MVCCSSSCAALFDFLSSCGVHLIHIEYRLFNQRFGRQRCRSGGHRYSGHFNFIIYFCRHMPLYAINLDAVSLFADSYFTFLAVLNDVISQFEWMNIILFLSKKKLSPFSFDVVAKLFINEISMTSFVFYRWQVATFFS